jgi:hypothetical protein
MRYIDTSDSFEILTMDAQLAHAKGTEISKTISIALAKETRGLVDGFLFTMGTKYPHYSKVINVLSDSGVVDETIASLILDGNRNQGNVDRPTIAAKVSSTLRSAILAGVNEDSGLSSLDTADEGNALQVVTGHLTNFVTNELIKEQPTVTNSDSLQVQRVNEHFYQEVFIDGGLNINNSIAIRSRKDNSYVYMTAASHYVELLSMKKVVESDIECIRANDARKVIALLSLSSRIDEAINDLSHVHTVAKLVLNSSGNMFRSRLKAIEVTMSEIYDKFDNRHFSSEQNGAVYDKLFVDKSDTLLYSQSNSEVANVDPGVITTIMDGGAFDTTAPLSPPDDTATRDIAPISLVQPTSAIKSFLSHA